MQTLMISSVLTLIGFVNGQSPLPEPPIKPGNAEALLPYLLSKILPEDENINDDNGFGVEELPFTDVQHSNNAEDHLRDITSTTDNGVLYSDNIVSTETGTEHSEKDRSTESTVIVTEDSESFSEIKGTDPSESTATLNPIPTITRRILTSTKSTELDPKAKHLLYFDGDKVILHDERTKKRPTETEAHLLNNTEKTEEDQQIIITQKSNSQPINIMLYFPVILMSLCLIVFILALTISTGIVWYGRGSLFRFKNLKTVAPSV